MTTPLLDVVRGPLLTAAVVVFVLGVSWRLTALALRRRAIDPAASRGTHAEWLGALRTVVDRFFPARPYRQRLAVQALTGHVFHLGYFAIVLLGAPHVLFLADLTGVVWWTMPKGLLDAVSAITLGALLLALFLRLRTPARRLISDADDYASWLVTTLPVVTGLLTTTPPFGRYEHWLAVHLLSVELLLVWIPFSKLFHAFTWVLSRATTGARFAHRGVPA